MYVLTLRKYMGQGLSAFPLSGDVAEAVKQLIKQKSESPGFFATGFFKKPRTEYRYDIYKVADLDQFNAEKIQRDKELKPLRDIKNSDYRQQGMEIVNEQFVYDEFQNIPKVFIDNILDPSKDYYTQILQKINQQSR